MEDSIEKDSYKWLPIMAALLMLSWGASIFLLPDVFNQYDSSKWGSLTWLARFLAEYWTYTISMILFVVGLLFMISGIREGNTKFVLLLSGILFTGVSIAILNYPDALSGYKVEGIHKGGWMVRIALWVWNETAAYVMAGLALFFLLGMLFVKNDK